MIPEPVRTVAITPPSIRAETTLVLQAAVVIVIATWLYVANATAPARPGGTTNAPASAVSAYQRLFSDLSPHDQRLFRALHEGLLEAENVRSATGSWPSAEKLAEQGVPPFAADPISSRDRYVWSKREESNVINYVGIPAAANLPAFLLLVLEPAPGAPPDPAPNDEQHHRLANGDVLHVSVWMHPTPSALKGELVVIPEEGGWTQLLSGNTAAPSQ